MLGEELLHERQNFRWLVFEHEVAGVGEAVDFSRRQDALPLGEEVLVEDPVLFPPANQRGGLAEQVELRLSFADRREGRVLRRERDVLHEAKLREAAGLGGVRREIGVALDGREHAGAHAPARDEADEKTGLADEQRVEGRVAADPKRRRELLRLGEMERTGVQQHESRDAFRMPRGVGHANHPAPVMHHERELRRQLQVLDECFEVAHAALQRELVMRVVGLVGEAAADVVGHDDAALPAQAEHELAVVEGPRRIPMQHHDSLAAALVEVVHGDAVAVEEVTDKGVVFAAEVHGAEIGNGECGIGNGVRCRRRREEAPPFAPTDVQQHVPTTLEEAAFTIRVPSSSTSARCRCRGRRRGGQVLGRRVRRRWRRSRVARRCPCCRGSGTC